MRDRTCLGLICVGAALLLAVSAGATMLPGLQGGRALYRPMVAREAAASGLPSELADAVAMVETGYRPDAIGSSGEIGIMQIMPATALQLGFRGTLAELAEPSVNIRLAVRYLARAWALGGGDVCRALMKYRAGLGQEVMTTLSVRYCTRATAWLQAAGGVLPGGVKLRYNAGPRLGDPYMVAVVPALAAMARVVPMLATAHELVAGWRPHRLMADRIEADNARFRSHQHQYPWSTQKAATVRATLTTDP